jgi:predicted NodU family carbamoyl transferase
VRFAESTERYHDLIPAFHHLTGVPILLNTSFNVMGKPRPRSPRYPWRAA